MYGAYKTKLPKLLTKAAYYREQEDLSIVSDILYLNTSLFKPSQRIWSFKHFLRRILELTPLSHDDLHFILIAWQQYRKFISEIDSAVKSLEAQECLKELESKIENWKVLLNYCSLIKGFPLESYGPILHNGVLFVGDKHCLHQVYLFKDLLLFLKPKKSDSRTGKLTVAHKIMLTKASIKFMVLSNSEGAKFSFRIAYISRTYGARYVDCFASNSEIRDQWQNLLRNFESSSLNFNETTSKMGALKKMKLSFKWICDGFKKTETECSPQASPRSSSLYDQSLDDDLSNIHDSDSGDSVESVLDYSEMLDRYHANVKQIEYLRRRLGGSNIHHQDAWTQTGND